MSAVAFLPHERRAYVSEKPVRVIGYERTYHGESMWIVVRADGKPEWVESWTLKFDVEERVYGHV